MLLRKFLNRTKNKKNKHLELKNWNVLSFQFFDTSLSNLLKTPTLLVMIYIETKTPSSSTDDIRHWFPLVPTWSFCSASELLSAWDFNCCTFRMLKDSKKKKKQVGLILQLKLENFINIRFHTTVLYAKESTFFTSNKWWWVDFQNSKNFDFMESFQLPAQLQTPPPTPIFDKALSCDHQHLVILHHLQILLVTSHVASHVVSATLDALASKLLRQYLISEIFPPVDPGCIGFWISWVVNLQHINQNKVVSFLNFSKKLVFAN